MREALEQIAARPALVARLVSGAWEAQFDHGTLSRSRGYANETGIQDVGWIDLAGTGELVVTASVQGSRRQPYETSLVFTDLRGDWIIETDCSCPVMERCKHAAALLSLLRGHLSGSPAKQPRSDRRSTLERDPQLTFWLDEVEQASLSAASKETESPSAGSDRFLAYCIEEPASSYETTRRFVMRVGQRLKDGTVRIQNSVATADPVKPAKYMAPEDVWIATLYHQRQRKHGGWGEMVLEGETWDELLDGALATGRLFFGKMAYSDRHGTAHRVLGAGDPEPVEALWETLPDGSVRPVVRSARAGLIFLPIVPPRYLDPENCVLGPIASGLPPHVLATWSQGPAIRPENIPALIERLARFPGATLPTPKSIETVTRPARPPRPVLRVRKLSLGPSWDRDDYFIGELSFQYDDSPRLLPLTNTAPRQHSGLIDGKRVIWPRDFKAERAAEAKLLRCPFKPFSKAVHQRFLDAANRHAVVPERLLPSPEEAWLELIHGPALDPLRDDGWTIEIDPKAGLAARDASNFVPAIEVDSDHGIDWFRFDISYEVDGKCFSLIPIIARAIRQDYPPADSPELPEHLMLPCEDPEDGFIRFPARQLMEIVDQVRHLFLGNPANGGMRLDRLSAAAVADALAIDSSETTRTLARLGRGLRDIKELPPAKIPKTVKAGLRHYQEEGFRWLQFLAEHRLHGILADDMGLGKTLQTLTHLAAERTKKPGRPSLVVAPTSVVPNWAAEAARFVPALKVLMLHGPNRADLFDKIPKADVVLTSYPLLGRDFEVLSRHDWHLVVLDEAQHIKNPKAIAARSACQLKAAHRLCLSGTPMENHLGELWSLMRFLMPGFLGDEKSFNSRFRKPIERERSSDIQQTLNRRVSSLILRRTKDQVATELPTKTEIIHHVDLTKKQTGLYESVRASMDKRVLEAIAAKGLAKSHIIVLDALLKLRQICCHPQLLKSPAARKVTESAKFDYLSGELLPTLFEEGRRILLFSQFTSVLSLIEARLEKENIPFLKLTGQTRDRGALVKKFQSGEVPVFLISLKAGGTGLNLTAADTVIHYDPWWNPAAENQATDRAHRIGQTQPVFVHKLVCRGTIEDRILELQKHKSARVEALLSDETAKLKIDPEALSHLLAPLE